MNIRNVIIVISIVIFVLLALAVIVLYQYARSKYGVNLEVDFTKIVAREDYDVRITEQSEEVTYLTKDSGDNFKILAFTDMHFDGLAKAPMDKTMNEFLNAMNQEQPDLVIFTGDTVTAIFNKERAKLLAEIMEAYGVYWCAILGNHEGEHPLSYKREKLIKLWANDIKYPHCLVEPGPEDISGYGNYIVNLLSTNKKIIQSLIFMDSGDYVTKEDINTVKYGPGAYDYIKADQIAWCQEQIKALPEGTKSSLFIHIPLNEYAIGWDEIYDEASRTITDTADCKYVDGFQREAVCCSEYNSGLFAVIETLGSMRSVYCGHDHVNDYSIVYKGVKLNYLQASGYSIYGWNDETAAKTEVLEEQSMQGYTILEIDKSGETQITRIRYKKKGYADYE